MHVISLCPTPFEPNGHGAVYHLSLCKAIEKTGGSHQAFLTIDSHCEYQKWIPYFKKNRIREFSRIFRQKIDGRRIFFIESFKTKDLCALAFAAFFSLKKDDRLWILFRYGRHQLPLKGRLHIALLKLLKNKALGLTDSDLIAEDFSPQIKLEVLPIPHAHFSLSKKRLTPPYLCWWPGQPRPAKGLIEISLIAQSNHPDFKLMLSKETDLSRHSPLKIEWLSSILTREEYLKYLNKSALIFLPYDPMVYKCGTSGIFVEAIVAGKIPLVKEGSWLAHELRKYDLEELIVDWADPKFFDRTLTLIESEAIHKKLKQMQSHYRAFHSIEHFAELVVKLMPQVNNSRLKSEAL